MLTNLRVWAISLAIVAGASQQCLALSGDPQAGKLLAQTWCSSCHLVSPDQASATTEAPPFESIAAREGDSLSWIGPFLADPHPPMQEFALTRIEIRDLAAYIASLKPQN